MTIVNSRVFADNPIHYLNLSKTEEVAVKRGNTVFQIKPKPAKAKNKIDPDDPYWDDPRNVEELDRRLKELDEGKVELIEYTPEKRKEWFGHL